MGHISKRLQQAIDAVRAMPADQQDLLAIEMLERAEALARPPTNLTPQERTGLEAELAAARRGELATEAGVAAVFNKHGLKKSATGPPRLTKKQTGAKSRA